MAKRTSLQFFMLAMLTLTLGACGGGSTGGQVSLTNPALVQSQSDGEAPPVAALGGLPSLPLDWFDPGSRAVSNGGGDGNGDCNFDNPWGRQGSAVVMGADALQYWNAEIDDTALVLTAPEAAEAGDPLAVAYGLYKVSGLLNTKPRSLQVECIPGHFGQSYYIGIGNYSDMTWEWFDQTTLPELQVDLSESSSRYITNLGNLYFILVTDNGQSCKHLKTTALFKHRERDRERPGAPFDLEAADGEFADRVAVTWRSCDVNASFEVWRKLADSDEEWQVLGETGDGEQAWSDYEVESDVVYKYKVRAVNDCGHSAFSNKDTGFATGGGGTDPVEFSISGWVMDSEGVALPAVQLTLVAEDGTESSQVSGPDGGFSFTGLAEASYVLTPQAGDWSFTPEMALFDLREAPRQEVTFIGWRNVAEPRTISGRAGRFDEEGVFVPAVGVQVMCLELNFGDFRTAKTNEQGEFEFLDLSNGTWQVTANCGGEPLLPDAYEIVIDGINVPGALLFIGGCP